MRAHTQSTQPLQRSLVTVSQSLGSAWHRHVGIRAERQLGRVSALYHHRVTLPVLFWRACGCPAPFTPRLPWWQPFVYRFLVLVGRRPLSRLGA